MSIRFQPITRANAASVLHVSLRTIDMWVASGTMPAPQHIGRHSYWHPEIFYEWLNRCLRPTDDAPSELPEQKPQSATPLEKIAHTDRRQSARRGSAQAARQRDEARLEQMKAAK